MYFNKVIILVFSVIIAHTSSEKSTCDLKPVEMVATWRSMEALCIEKMENQIDAELSAAMTYMAMGSYFAQDTVNRPGFSKMFFESANEEREHAIKIISYLLMRGGVTTFSNLIKKVEPKNTKWANGLAALNESLALEVSVTDKIREIIKTCENPGNTAEGIPLSNDYHLVDYLTGDFLEEQYNGQRDLAGKISTLGKMMLHHGPIGEFLFDKKLLNGQLL